MVYVVPIFFYYSFPLPSTDSFFLVLNSNPADTRRHFNVYKTSIRCRDVVQTSYRR